MTAEMSSRLEFLGQLAGGLAHEIKNPLSTMKLTLQLLEEDFERDESAPAQRSLHKVRVLLKEVAHLDDIVRQFLRLARGLDLRLARTDLREMIRELLEFLGEEAARRGITLRADFAGDLDGLLLDANYLRQALMNLAMNAMDAVEAKGGEGEVILRARRQGDVVQIEIIDTGCGIANTDRERIFRPYFTRKRGGTGMGLPVVRRIVEEHGGQISFESEEGRGSRFMILLPADPEKRGSLRALVKVEGPEPEIRKPHRKHGKRTSRLKEPKRQEEGS